MLEDSPFEAAQVGGRVEAELVERRAGLAVGGEGLRLPARAVEGEHALALETLSVGVARDEGVELAGDRRVTAGREIGVDPRFDGRKAALLEACRFCRGKQLVRHVGEGRPPPERESVVGLPEATSPSNRSRSSSPGSTRTR